MDEREHGAPGAAFDPLQVSLPYFDGPLDLLLHLVRKQQVDINQVRLGDLTEPYLAYVERIQELNLDQAGEFLAIAATLVWIKSRSLLPRDEDAEPDLDPETVEELLLLRLQEYQRIKESARELAGRDLLGRDIFPRQGGEDPDAEAAAGLVFEEVSLFNLLEAFRRVLERVEDQPRNLNVVPERIRIEDKIAEVVASLRARSQIHFHDLFLPDATRSEIIITFMAILELTRLKAIRLVQSGIAGTILCEGTEALAAAGDDLTAQVLSSITGEPAPADPPDRPHAPAGHG